jgi:hypothetical protein
MGIADRIIGIRGFLADTNNLVYFGIINYIISMGKNEPLSLR